MTDQALAEESARLMWAQDRASQGLGMVIDHIAPGEAVLSMSVRDDMANGIDICHGGFIFALADSTFAFACNSDGQHAVAQHCAVTFTNPAHRGDRLTAHAKERSRAGRGGIYDVTVRNADGKVVAEFRGHSRTVKGRFAAAAPTDE